MAKDQGKKKIVVQSGRKRRQALVYARSWRVLTLTGLERRKTFSVKAFWDLTILLVSQRLLRCCPSARLNRLVVVARRRDALSHDVCPLSSISPSVA